MLLTKSPLTVPSSRVLLLPVSEIRPNPAQPRRVFDPQALQELADSIAVYGILQPLSVRRTPSGWELIAGERRLRAARIAGLAQVPCIALSADEQAYFQPTIAEMESEAADLGLGADGAYALAWIKLWVESYNAQTDDGPICNTLVDASAKDQFGLLVYSKLRSVEESSSVSVNNIKVAAYEDGYQGIGGYGYCHYLFVTDNSPLPWTACAFIAYMTCTADGFSAWGKDMGGYSSNPTVAEETEANFHHSIGGMAEDGTTVEFAAKNDRGYEWWTTNGKLVLEDPEYCADVAFTVGSWIEMLSKYSAG